MKKLCLCLLLLNFYTSKGQSFNQSLNWYEGSVVLATGRVVTGKISLDAFHGIMLLEQDTIRTVYPAHKIRSLYFYDTADNINRRFLSVKDRDLVRASWRFYEVVLQGEINVLRRQKLNGRKLADASDFTYHLQYNDEILGLRAFIKKVYPRLDAPFNERLKDFIRVNKLSANTLANAIRIIEFYDQIIRANDALAKQ